MFGLILKHYLNYTTQDPVQVAVLDKFATLMEIVSVDPSSAAASWPRADIVPLARRDVESQFGGGTLEAYVCTLRTTDFQAEFTAGGVQ
jgi:hypothetical protein